MLSIRGGAISPPHSASPTVRWANLTLSVRELVKFELHINSGELAVFLRDNIKRLIMSGTKLPQVVSVKIYSLTQEIGNSH